MRTKDIHVEVLQIAGIPVFFSCAFDTYQLFRLNLDAHKLLLLPAFDTLLALNLSRGIVPFEHQINSVKKLLGRFRGRGMLCDEVGLGKTIEASLAMLELITRGLIKKILILVPPSLIEQWKEETFFKFNLEFITSDDKDFKAHGGAAWGKSDRIIASIHTAKKSPHADAIKQEDFDLITRKRQEATDLKRKETERIKKYYDTLNEEMEDALEKKTGDREAMAAIQSKQKAVLAQRQSSLDDIEFRYKMSAGMSLVSVLVTNYPCYISKASVPSVLQPSGYDVIWNPLFRRFEPLACPACKNQSYALHFLRTGIRCQNCLKN